MKKIALAAVLVCIGAAPAFANEEKMKMMVDDKFSKCDTNNDSMISEEEHAVSARKMFEEADTNGDKALSKDEVMAAKKKEWAKFKMDDAPVSNDTKTNTKKH